MSEEIEEESLALKISFANRTLQEWETELTRHLPLWPCNSSDMIVAIIDLNTKYQNATNCLNDLMILYTQANREFKKKTNLKVAEKLAEYREAGVVKNIAKDTIETIVMSEDNELNILKDDAVNIEVVKVFFESNKQKLEKTMMLAKDLLYSISATERATNRVDTHTSGY